jgi:hypothetical protein
VLGQPSPRTCSTCWSKPRSAPPPRNSRARRPTSWPPSTPWAPPPPRWGGWRATGRFCSFSMATDCEKYFSPLLFPLLSSTSLSFPLLYSPFLLSTTPKVGGMASDGSFLFVLMATDCEKYFSHLFSPLSSPTPWASPPPRWGGWRAMGLFICPRPLFTDSFPLFGFSGPFSFLLSHDSKKRRTKILFVHFFLAVFFILSSPLTSP